MKPGLRLFAAALLAVLLALPAADPARAQSFNADQRGEIERIIKEYLLSNPELLQEVMAELEKRQAVAEAEKHRTAVKQHSAAIFNSPRQVTLGNPQGDVTVVEFFDYNCGYCKRAMTDMLELHEGRSASSSSCSRNSRSSARLRCRRRRSRPPCACRTRPAARSISSSIRSC